ncbi:MAG: HzsA-related protein, partial [Candidatus Zipacnadales bacterium]
ATLAVMNVYDADLPFPEGTRIKWLRVTQNILKTNPWMGIPMIGYQNENTPRIPLGIVPVEEDGSAYFEAPIERPLIFQALDENYMAVQSMRSVAYVHPGEQLTCQGCHEPTDRSVQVRRIPLALRRPPSRLQPEVGPIEPITYYRLVKPVFERSCIPCHREQGQGPLDMSYEALEPYVFYFAGGMSRTTTKPIHGGSRTIPGRFGARNCRMGQALMNANHRGKISQEDYHRVVLWLDSNSLRLGAYEGEQRQMQGELIWPSLDVDPRNPQGLERLSATYRDGTNTSRRLER